uniref:Uncharacterized protein n=1 Tax=Alexandrium monilatum TaxID=311494 RepID=A0A7S4PVR0_9DINO
MAEPLLDPTWDAPQADWRKWLGRWRGWIRPEVLERADRLEEQGKRVTHFDFSGLAVKKVWSVTFVQWGFAIVYPFLVCLVSVCPAPYEPFARYPNWVYLIFLFVVAYSFWHEIQALRYVLCTYAMYCAPFSLFGLRLTSTKWLMFVGMVGLTSHADLLTNGLFLSKILTTVSCNGPKAETIQLIWFHTIHKSVVGWVPGFDHLDSLMLIGWGLMFFQPLLCFLYTWPLLGSEVDYGVASMPNGYETPWTFIWRRCGGRRVVHHADALQMLGAVNRMTSLTDKMLTWCKARSYEEMRGVRPNKVFRALDIMYREYSRITHRLWLVSIMEKAFMLEVQVTVFAISRSLMPQDMPFWLRLDGQLLISIVLSGMTYMKVLYDSWSQDRTMCKFVDTIKRHPDYIEKQDDDDVKTIMSNIRYKQWVSSRMGMLVLVAFLVHSLTKFIMAFVCKDSLWDIPMHDGPGLDWKGCVDLGLYLRPN